MYVWRNIFTMYGICHVPVAPLYKSPSFTTEMIGQLLAGEQVEVLEAENTWLFVVSQQDGFQGWVDPKMIETLLEGQAREISSSFAGVVKTPLLCARDQYGRSFHLPAGSRLYTHGSSIAVAPGRNLEVQVKQHLILPSFVSRKELVTTALGYNGAPFQWGGRTILGIDCAGLIQIAFAINGLPVPRKIDQLVELGNVVPFSAESQPGDVAFFENQEGQIMHVGMVIDKGRIIHAYGEVKVDLLDHEGIFNKNTRQYTHKLRVIKNIVDSF
jgi:gamma-D-glutamyl-L-lysine dipeptidyl-peptidase